MISRLKTRRSTERVYNYYRRHLTQYLTQKLVDRRSYRTYYRLRHHPTKRPRTHHTQVQLSSTLHDPPLQRSGRPPRTSIQSTPLSSALGPDTRDNSTLFTSSLRSEHPEHHSRPWSTPPVLLGIRSPIHEHNLCHRRYDSGVVTSPSTTETPLSDPVTHPLRAKKDRGQDPQVGDGTVTIDYESNKGVGSTSSWVG